MTTHSIGSLMVTGLKAIGCIILWLNGFSYLRYLASWGLNNEWHFTNVQGWGFLFLNHLQNTVLAILLVVPSWLYLKYMSRVKPTIIRSRVLSIVFTLGMLLYALGVSLEIYLPKYFP